MDRSASSHLVFSVILRVPGEWGTRGHYSEFRFAHNTDSSKLCISDFEDFKKLSFGATLNLLCLPINVASRSYRFHLQTHVRISDTLNYGKAYSMCVNQACCLCCSHSTPNIRAQYL